MLDQKLSNLNKEIDNIFQDDGIGKESVYDPQNMERKAKIGMEFSCNGRFLDRGVTLHSIE